MLDENDRLMNQLHRPLLFDFLEIERKNRIINQLNLKKKHLDNLPVRMPPIMAQIEVKKCNVERQCSVYLTSIGPNS